MHCGSGDGSTVITLQDARYVIHTITFFAVSCPENSAFFRKNRQFFENIPRKILHILNILEKCCILEKSRKKLVKFGENSERFSQNLRNFWEKTAKNSAIFMKILRLEKWLAARCLLASRFLVFFLFGVVLARPFFPHFSHMHSKTVQRSALCRSRREVSNEYLLAKIGFDTAENEPLKVRITDHTFDHIPSFL